MSKASMVKPGYQIMEDLNNPNVVADIYKKIEYAGRQCYQSQHLVADNSAEKFVRMVVNRGHEAMLEHAGLTVTFTVDRGISHELVRHRIASFAQESSRYCNYSKDKFGNAVTFIKPEYHLQEGENLLPDWWYTFINEWFDAANETAERYIRMTEQGVPPEWARDILINSVKTNIVVTANMREWRNILKLRAAGVSGKPHPQMLEVMVPLLNELKIKLPALFDDIG